VAGTSVVGRRARGPAETGHYEGGLQIASKGNLATILSAAQNAKRSPETGDLSLQVMLVAGARNRCQLPEWWVAA
jgi:hypothetical protein